MNVKFEVQGQPIKEWELNPSQEKFVKSINRYIANVGGRGSGKSLGLVLKTIQLLLKYPNNYGLLGRFNYTDLRDTTERDFFDTCPKEYIQGHNKQEKTVTFINKSRLIFRGLKDIKKTEVRSLNLGFFGLEQAEEIDESLFDELSACLRRKLKDFEGNEGKQQGFILANPVINWITKKFLQEKLADYEYIQSSTIDNAQNLPDVFLKDLLSKPESWKRVFVYGELPVLGDKAVVPEEYIVEQTANVKEPVKRIEDIVLWAEREPSHTYQVGADPSEGAADSSVIKGVDTWTGEEVACYVSRIQPDLLAFKIDKLGRYLNNAKVVLEMNGIGLATLTKLRELEYPNIYVREEFDKRAKVMTKKLGWRTTYASKPLLLGNFLELLNKKEDKPAFVKIRDAQTVEEMKTIVYSDEATKKGFGAERSFHDDRFMATMLAYWELKGEQRVGDDQVIVRPQETVREDRERLHLHEILQPKAKHWLEH